jgi:hypothetical protein
MLSTTPDALLLVLRAVKESVCLVQRKCFDHQSNDVMHSDGGVKSSRLGASFPSMMMQKDDDWAQHMICCLPPVLVRRHRSFPHAHALYHT